MADYQRRLSEFEALGVEIAGISVDDGARSERVRRQFGLTFPLLSDPSRETIEAWGLRRPEGWRDLSAPATILVERDGTLGFVSFDGVRFRVPLDAVLDRLRSGSREPVPPLRWVRAWPTYWARAISNVGRHGMKMKHPR